MAYVLVSQTRPFWTCRDAAATRVKCVATRLTGTKEDGDLDRMDNGRPLSSANGTYIVLNFCIQYRLTEQKSTVVMIAYINDGLYTLLPTHKRAEACPWAARVFSYWQPSVQRELA
jgi:hypothetical protein